VRTEPDLVLARKLSIVAWVLTVAILLLIGMMRRVKLDVGVDFSALPAVNAIVNSVTAVVLLLAWVYIRNNRVEAHRKMIFVAMGLSLVFVICYVLYHFTTSETSFCGTGWTRPMYYAILISHVVLAAVIFPFVLFTFIRGFTGQYARHRRMARWVFWVWLYVALSGPAVYLMLAPCYGN
jgi:putative membrane protein